MIIRDEQPPVNGGLSGISVCFDRAHRLAASSEHKVRLLPGQPTNVDFGESLTLVTTLLRDPRTGNYKEKLAKLIVRSKGSLSGGGTGFRGLGLASLPLHRLVADFQSQQFQIPLTNNTQAVGRIDVVISSKFIGEVRVLLTCTPPTHPNPMLLPQLTSPSVRFPRKRSAITKATPTPASRSPTLTTRYRRIARASVAWGYGVVLTRRCISPAAAR